MINMKAATLVAFLFGASVAQAEGKKVKGDRNISKSVSSGFFISTTIKSDEYVLFYPALASLDLKRRVWTVEIHGLIYEHTAFSESMPFISRVVTTDNVNSSKSYKNIYKKRLGWFFVDNESRKQLTIKLKGKAYQLRPSGYNGHFKGIIKIPAVEVKQWSLDSNDRISFSVRTTAQDKRLFEGEIYFIAPHGVSVISDIDDTIKLSEVHDKKKLILNTFFRPYRDIPGMADSYRQWSSAHNVKFHYVTSSPWQLYVPLRKFMELKKFPPGSFHMKYFRVKDKSFFNIFSKSMEYKIANITKIINKYPYRYFILVGDSGEKDLQVYKEISKRFPGRVNVIYIRNTGHSRPKDKSIMPVSQNKSESAPIIKFHTNHHSAKLKYHGPRNSSNTTQSDIKANNR